VQNELTGASSRLGPNAPCQEVSAKGKLTFASYTIPSVRGAEPSCLRDYGLSVSGLVQAEAKNAFF